MTPIEFSEDYILYFFNIPYIGPICTFCYIPCYNCCKLCYNYICSSCSCCTKLIFNGKNFHRKKVVPKNIPTSEFFHIHRSKREVSKRKRFKEYNLEILFLKSTFLMGKINQLKQYKNLLLDYRKKLGLHKKIICLACQCVINMGWKKCLICKSYYHNRCILLEEDENFRCVRCMFYKCDFCDRSDDMIKRSYVTINNKEIDISEKFTKEELFFTNSQPTMVGHKRCILKNRYEILHIQKKPVLEENNVQSFNYRYMIRFILTSLSYSLSFDYIAQYVNLYCICREEYFNRIEEMKKLCERKFYLQTIPFKRIFNAIKFKFKNKIFVCTVNRVGIIYSDQSNLNKNVVKLHLIPHLTYDVGFDVPRTFIKNRINIQVSSIEGIGLFSTEFFLKNEPICIYRGIRLKKSESDLMERYYKANNFNSIYLSNFHFSGVLYVEDETIYGTYSKYINHSCAPNCYTKYTYNNDSVDIGIYAKRNILPGEELTYNYELSTGEKIKCLCGEKNCKKYL